MAATPLAFLDGLKAQVKLIAILGVPIVGEHVWITDEIDWDNIPNYPGAAIIDRGGELHPHTPVIDFRRVEVVLFDAQPRGPLGEETVRNLLALFEALRDVLHNDTTHSLNLAEEEEVETYESNDGVITWKAKKTTWDYVLRRS